MYDGIIPTELLEMEEAMYGGRLPVVLTGEAWSEIATRDLIGPHHNVPVDVVIDDLPIHDYLKTQGVI